jgi:hypothetical protein
MAIAQAISYVTGGALTGNTFTLTSWTPTANTLCLIGVFQRNEAITPTVAGNGLTWVQVATVDDGDAVAGMSVFRAMGASPSAGQITVTVTGNLVPANAIAICLSGTDTSGTNGSGAVEASDTEATLAAGDNNDLEASVTTLTNNAWAILFGETRNRTFTTPSGQTAIATNLTHGTGGNMIRSHCIYTPAPTAGVYTLGGPNSMSGATDWTAIIVSVKPASGGGGAAATVGTTRMTLERRRRRMTLPVRL